MMNLKKLALLLPIIVFAASVTFAQSAGSAKGDGGLTNEQKMLPFALGMSLSVLGEMYDSNHYGVVDVIGKQIRYYGAELRPVIVLDADENEGVRRQTVDKATKALRAKSTPSDKWKMLVGEYFGNIYVQLKKHTSGDDINVDDLRFDIEMIGRMGDSAPDDIPSVMTKRFREFGKLKDLDDPTSVASVKKITAAVTGILDSITD